MRTPARLLAAGALVLASCGSEAPRPAPPPGGWAVARLEGLVAPSGLAALGTHLLLVSGGGDRRLYCADVAALVPGGAVIAREVPLDIDRDAYLTGGEELARRGYRLGDLWDRDVALVGVAVQAPDHLFLADRVWRVLWAGRLVLGRDGAPERARIERASVIPGADRSGQGASDWRDRSAGLADLTAIAVPSRAEDLFAVEREGPERGTFRVRCLDRYGFELQWFLVDLAPATEAAVGALARDDDRFLVVRGDGRGELVPFVEGGWTERVPAGRGVPGPDVPAAWPWTGLTVLPDGRLCLVGGGAQPALAWRPR